MIKGYPKITKLGATSPHNETSPFTFKGKVYRLELWDPTNGVDPNIVAKALIRERETGKIISSFGEGCYYYSYYGEGDKAYVLGTKSKKPSLCGDTIMIYESDDLINWTERELFHQDGWNFFNTSMTKGPDGYVLLVECNEPAEYVGEAFTLFFTFSKDMKTWCDLDPNLGYSKERYNGGPWMKYSNGWYYVISVTGLPCFRFTNYIFRTKDFRNWEVGKYNPFIMPDEDDKKISPYAVDFTPEILETIKTGFNSNSSDVDMCDMADTGKTLITYMAGNQLGFSFLCEAIYDGTVAELLENFFL